MTDRQVPKNLKPVVFCLVGPTAAGKTAVAIHLAEHFGFEIVSVDSAMVYRHMNIGTAKPSPDVLARFPHRLVDILDPWETYSAGQFRRDALREIGEIIESGRHPLLVGGTFLYFRALERGLADLPAADRELRARIDARAGEIGWPAMHTELAKRDPSSADRIGPMDRQRIQRALEVIELTGERLSDLHGKDEQGSVDYRYIRLSMLPSDRQVLHERVEQRLDEMMNMGFVEEVERLRAMPEMYAGCPSMRAVGYRQIWSYLDGEYDLKEAMIHAVVATRRLVKRQLTWLRTEPGAVRFDCLLPDVSTRIEEHIAGFTDESGRIVLA